MRRLVVVLALIACGKSDKSGPEATPKAESKPVAKETGKPTVDVDAEEKQVRICRRIDRDALAKLFEIESLTRTGGGTLIKGGGAPATLNCNYYEGSKVDGGVSFGFSLKATTELEKRDMLNRFTWEKYDGLGQPAEIGRAKDGEVFIQTVAKGAQLQVDLHHPKLAPADVEKRLVDATKAIIDQLPADATSEIR